MKTNGTHKKWIGIPLIGIALFLVLFVIAANYYPGGSNVSKTQEGFDWINNYWCDLFSKTSKNGRPNSGRFFALTGMIILFSSLASFWYYLPQFFHERRLNTIIIRYAGFTAMFLLIFVFTRFHDSVIGIGSTICAIPMAATLSELRKNQLRMLHLLGLFCILLILLNFFIYITNWWIAILPLLQKIALLTFLIWIVLVDLKCLVIKPKNNRVRPNVFNSLNAIFHKKNQGRYDKHLPHKPN
ncbi:hypothetical protein [Fluviicola sp.]|uniref:hypothetical protein n=1 Tax=Fluviicola sp. TaxID=1917219 RepID=UPI003D2B2486